MMHKAFSTQGSGVWFGLMLLASGQIVLADEPKPVVPVAADGSIPQLKLKRRAPENLVSEPPLALEVNAGVIPRAALRAELALGIGRFLRQVRTEPALARGRFVGWRVLGLFAGRSDVNVLVLRPGDTVLRINGRSVERPEEFKTIWDALGDAPELVLDIQRGGRVSKLRYSIAG
jgi:type II secretory pathway component PulC